MRIAWLRTTVLVAAGLAALSGQALAWGDAGHRMIGEEALRALPSDVPAFLKTPEAITDVGEFAREPDRWKGAGKVHDNERDPGHFIDLDDQGKTFAGMGLTEMPSTRSDFDAATRAKGFEPYKSGYLYYNLIDGNQQLVKDFAYWRVLSLLAARETDPVKKAWYQADLLRREKLTLRDLGLLAHYVGDSSQPLHLSIHYNGWGEYPNPEGFSKEPIHWPFEGVFVAKYRDTINLRGNIVAYEPCTDRIEACVAKRLNRSFEPVVPLYKLEKAGAFRDGTDEAKVFISKLLGRGASDLRDIVLDAWRDSKIMKVGFPGRTYDEFEAGKVADPYRDLYGE